MSLRQLKHGTQSGTLQDQTSGGSKNFENGGTEDNLSDPSSFISIAHNEIYAFYTEKAAFWQKCKPTGGGGAPPPFASATGSDNTENVINMWWRQLWMWYIPSCCGMWTCMCVNDSCVLIADFAATHWKLSRSSWELDCLFRYWDRNILMNRKRRRWLGDRWRRNNLVTFGINFAAADG